MDLEYIRLLYAYNQWANTRLLDQAEKLTPEQLHAPNNNAFGGVRDTLVHLMETEFFWASLIWPGKAIDIDWEPYEFDPKDYPDVLAIRTRWAGIESDLVAFIDKLTPEGEWSPARIIMWTDGGPMLHRRLWLSMLDVFVHATQHRSEIAMALTQYGQSPGELDLSLFVREHVPELAS
ncbi:MAG: DinB family protein [Nitrolancea sp.]